MVERNVDLATNHASNVIQALQHLESKHGNLYRVSKFLGLNPSLVWRAVHKSEITPALTRALVRTGNIERPPPKDPRPRVWMPTNNVDAAVAKLEEHYTKEEIFRAMRIVSVEWHTPVNTSMEKDFGRYG